MDHSIWYSLLEVLRWIVGYITSALTQDAIYPLIQSLAYVSLYLASTLQAMIIIILFWVGPFISLRILAIILAGILVVESFNLVLAIFGFIKKYVPVA